MTVSDTKQQQEESVVARAVLPAVPPPLEDLSAVELVLAQLLVDPVVGLAHPPRQPRPARRVHRVLLEVLYEVLGEAGN